MLLLSNSYAELEVVCPLELGFLCLASSGAEPSMPCIPETPGNPCKPSRGRGLKAEQ